MWMLISHTACSRSSCQKCSTRTARDYTCRGSAAWFRTMSRCIRSCKGSRLLEKRASVRLLRLNHAGPATAGRDLPHQRLQNRAQGLPAVADGELALAFQLAEGAAEGFVIEQRIVTETAGAARRIENEAFRSEERRVG